MKRFEQDKLSAEIAGYDFIESIADCDEKDSSFRFLKSENDSDHAKGTYLFQHGLHIGYEGGGRYGEGRRFIGNRNFTRRDANAMFHAGINDMAQIPVGRVPRWCESLAKAKDASSVTPFIGKDVHGYPAGSKVMRARDDRECILVGGPSETDPDAANLENLQVWNSVLNQNTKSGDGCWVSDSKSEALSRFDGHYLTGVLWESENNIPFGIFDGASDAPVFTGRYKLCQFSVDSDFLGIIAPSLDIATSAKYWSQGNSGCFYGRIWITDNENGEGGFTVGSLARYAPSFGGNSIRSGNTDSHYLTLFKKGTRYHIYVDLVNGYMTRPNVQMSIPPLTIPFMKRENGAYTPEKKVVVLRYRHGLVPGAYDCSYPAVVQV